MHIIGLCYISHMKLVVSLACYLLCEFVFTVYGKVKLLIGCNKFQFFFFQNLKKVLPPYDTQNQQNISLSKVKSQLFF